MSKPLDEIARTCLKALPLSDQHIVSTMINGELVAFEFRWSDGRLYKIVVSDAEHIGIENMAYPPAANRRR